VRIVHHNNINFKIKGLSEIKTDLITGESVTPQKHSGNDHSSSDTSIHDEEQRSISKKQVKIKINGTIVNHGKGEGGLQARS
jgi:magnesium-transporting ATPase (P-type)